jgi:hypothetical protein
MANLPVLDSAGNTKYLKTSGAGTDLDPHIPTDAVTIASGGVASGAVASGAVASGAIAAGAIAAGAKVAGAEIDGHSQTLGVTTGAAVITDAAGTVQQYLRGLVKLIVAKINIATVDTVTTITNAVGITNALLGGATSDAAVSTDATGSIHQYLRGLVKLWIAGLAAGEAHIGAVGGNTTIINVTPTLTVHANYVSGDYVGTSSTAGVISNAARVSGGTGVILGATLIDYALQSIAGELYIFDTAVTPPADSAAWSISDADMATCLGVIPFGAYYASALNSVSPAMNQNIPFKCATTSLYFCFVTRGAPAYASGDLTFRFMISQD